MARRSAAGLSGGAPGGAKLEPGAAARPLFVAEPPSGHLLRPPAVIDCSLVCAVLFGEPERDAASQLMCYRQLLAPRLLDQEVLNVAVTKSRRGLAANDATAAVAAYAELPVELFDPDLAEQLELALRYGLTGYDAAYLWLAAACRAPLLTFDRKLAAVAQRHLQSLGPAPGG